MFQQFFHHAKFFNRENLEFQKIIHIFENLNKCVAILSFEKTNFTKKFLNFIFLIFRILVVILTIIELAQTGLVGLSNSVYFNNIAKAHFFMLIFLALMTQLTLYANRQNLKKIHKYFNVLSKKFGSLINSKRFILIVLLNVLLLIFAVISAVGRTFARLFWRFDNLLNTTITILTAVNSLYTLFTQHYLTILYCNYLEAIRLHFEKLNELVRNMASKKLKNFQIRNRPIREIIECHEDAWNVIDVTKETFSHFLLINAVSSFLEMIFTVFVILAINDWSVEMNYGFLEFPTGIIMTIWTLSCFIDTMLAIHFTENVGKEVGIKIKSKNTNFL